MKVAIHQPEYWPIPRLLAKWAQVDLLILLDIVQFDRTSLQHRCKLASTDGQLRWLTIPFQHEGSRVIRDIQPHRFGRESWILRHWRTIREWYSYAESKRLDDIEMFYKGIAGERFDSSISDYAVHTMLAMQEWAAIATPIIFASSLTPPDGQWGTRADLVLNICRAVKATTYISGRAGAEYLLGARHQFDRANIRIDVQLYPESAEVPGLSSLHIYLQHGATRLCDLVRR